MAVQRLLRIRHDRRDLGFFCARIVTDDIARAGWCLRVESPADLDEYRGHLVSGASMALSMVTREGEYLRGEACVASVSGGVETASIVTLSGLGPLSAG